MRDVIIEIASGVMSSSADECEMIIMLFALSIPSDRLAAIIAASQFEKGDLALMSVSSERPDVEARTYEELFQFGGTLQSVRREHERLLPFFKNAHVVLDVGCGRGVFLQQIQEMGITPVGVDLFPEAVKACQDLGFKHVYHGEAVQFLRQHVSAFDGILCSHIIEHIPYQDAIDLVAAAYNALKPGGRYVIVTPNARDLRVIGEIFWLDPTHVRPYPMDLIKEMMTAVGFNVIHMEQPVTVPNKRAIPRWLMLRMLLGPYFGRLTTIIVGEKKADTPENETAKRGTIATNGRV